jgi:hypothetical protein
VEACLPQIEELADQAMSMTEYYKLCGDERGLLTLTLTKLCLLSTSKKSDSKTIVKAMPDTVTKEVDL